MHLPVLHDEASVGLIGEGGLRDPRNDQGVNDASDERQDGEHPERDPEEARDGGLGRNRTDDVRFG